MTKINYIGNINNFDKFELMHTVHAKYNFDTDESNDFEVWDIFYTESLPKKLKSRDSKMEFQKYVEYLKSLGGEVMKERLLNNDYVLYDEVKNWFDKKNLVI